MLCMSGALAARNLQLPVHAEAVPAGLSCSGGAVCGTEPTRVVKGTSNSK